MNTKKKIEALITSAEDDGAEDEAEVTTADEVVEEVAEVTTMDAVSGDEAIKDEAEVTTTDEVAEDEDVEDGARRLRQMKSLKMKTLRTRPR